MLNAVSWGIMLPVGGMVARWLKEFIPQSPAWFYLHVSCQLMGYSVGAAGWGTGLKLGSQSEGITYTTHRNIGIALFSLGTLQVHQSLLCRIGGIRHVMLWSAYKVNEVL